ncbi:GntR family transcriptional regulator [Rhizobium sp. P38BS-XIX]|uniref:GntR family transcriptional regulator n=1 Tax=Rhizobium sp. P38BS-XIX TaxID=2726740 RepID=UPI001457537D|nr:GntR family transcriptional regulator [Rhizobium sp. P38BS-XIX]NLS01272.1 GntR family transcriptional regulator [Rhizobium sp. P38BS-XIX]
MNEQPLAKALTPSATLASSIYERLKADILSTVLEPGRKLQLRFLIEHYGAGQTPLREALNRLASEELVEGKDQRGFFVRTISREELQELTKTRCWVETLALRESMAHRDQAWEEHLLLTHHRLSRTPRSRKPETFEDNPEWERLHRQFHHVLISQCGSRPLIAFCEQLADRLYRYRQISIRKAFRTRHVSDEHEAILKAVLSGDIELSVGLLEQHYRRTAEVVIEDLGH